MESLRLHPENGLLQISWVEKGKDLMWRTLVPSSLQTQLLHEWHDSVTGGHLGQTKTWGRAKQSGFFWTSMRESIRYYVKRCLVCAARKPGGVKKQHELVKINPGHKFEMVGMDLVGPLPISDSNNRYILTVTDYWTRWCDAYPIPDKSSATVAKTFMSRWVTQHGTPLSILSDQGGEFCSELFQECCLLMNSWKMRTTPFHPRCNGLTERLNQTIERMLSAFVAENQKDWDDRLPYVMMAYRSAVQDSTGVSPYSMLYGDDMPVPLDWVFKPPKNVPQDKILYVRELRSKINSAYDHARRCLLSAIARQKRNYDRGVRNITFKVGEFVMCHDKTKKVGRNPALRPRWRGPYVITRMLNAGTAVIQMSASARELTVHVDRLKHCFPPFKGHFKWAEEYLVQANPDIAQEWEDGKDPSLSEGDGVPVQDMVNQSASSAHSEIGSGSGFSSLCESQPNLDLAESDYVGQPPARGTRKRVRRPARQRNLSRRETTQELSNGRASESSSEERTPRGAGLKKDPTVPTDTSKGPVPGSPLRRTRGGRVVRKPVRYGFD